jgi:flagellar P-ring protein precursor FlgI
VALALRPVGADSARADSTGAAWAEFLAAVDTLSVTPHDAARVVIDARAGTVVAGGDARVGPAVVSQSGITLEVGSAERVAGPAGDARVRLGAAASVEDVAAGLHAAGVRPEEIVAILEALRAAGALRAEVVVR